MRNWKRNTALAMAAVMTASSIFSVSAAAPEAVTDEALYGNLDYYGTMKSMNIVKGVSLNGQTQISDYGDYSEVKNMTSDIAPQISTTGVTFDGLDGKGRFYYQVTPKSLEEKLPWTVDISYKLNGVPAQAENLAGASGMVEIDIHITPVQDTADYLKNNMLLTVATTIDMTKNLSVEAPGAQIQALGGTEAVMFAALPGEEKDFVIRIGSDQFSLDAGIVFAMAPATMDGLDKIKDLAQAKDDVKDSVHKLYDGTNAALEAIAGVRPSLNEATQAIKVLDQAREKVHSYGDRRDGNVDTDVQNLNRLANATVELVPHLNTAKSALDDFDLDFRDISTQAKNVEPEIDKVNRDLIALKESLKKTEDVLKNGQSNTKDLQSALDDLSSHLGDTQDDLYGFRKEAKRRVIPATASNAFRGNLKDRVEGLHEALSHAQLVDTSEADARLERYYSELKTAAKKAQDTQEAMDDFLSSTEDTISSLESLLSHPMQDALKNIHDGLGTVNDLQDQSQTLLQGLSQASGKINPLIESATRLSDTMSSYKESAKLGIDSTNNLLNSVSVNLDSARDTLTTIESLFQNTRGDLNDGTKASLKAGTDLIDHALNSMTAVDQLKSANDALKALWDKKVSEFENDNNVLKIDPEAKKVSFTSSENAEPNSVQVILRTEEIKVNDDEEKAQQKALEDAKENESPLKRIIGVFSEIFSSILHAFKNM